MIFFLFGAGASFLVGLDFWDVEDGATPDSALTLYLLARIGLLLVMGFSCRAVARLRFSRRRCWDSPQPRCNQCGYNLTGNTSGVCPECGTPVQPVPRSHGLGGDAHPDEQV